MQLSAPYITMCDLYPPFLAQTQNMEAKLENFKNNLYCFLHLKFSLFIFQPKSSVGRIFSWYYLGIIQIQ